jgi:hypothetical protein
MARFIKKEGFAYPAKPRHTLLKVHRPPKVAGPIASNPIVNKLVFIVKLICAK